LLQTGKFFTSKIIEMKIEIEIDNQTTATIGVVVTLLIIECLMQVFKVNYIIDISINMILCLFLNIYNYKRFTNFETRKDVQLTNKKLAFASLFINLPFVIGVIAILISLY
jgi:hypothetical protein